MLFGSDKRLEVALVILIAVIAAVVYSSFSWNLPWRFNSPDEMANANFSLRFAQNEELPIEAPLNEVAGNNIVHPRSTTVIQGKLVPSSFLGLPLIYGSIAKFLGTDVLPYLTPFFGLLALLALYFFIRELFDRRTALIFVVLVASLPAWWYYHTRAFFHNALFFDLLAILLYLSQKILRPGWAWQYILAGLVFGLALMVRTSEIFWLLAAAVVWFLFNHSKIRLGPTLAAGVSALVAFSPTLLMNKVIYGSYLSFGYRLGIEFTSINLEKSISFLRELILPFGLHPQTMILTVQNYLLGLQWWWTILAVVGVFFVIWNWLKFTSVQRSYLIAWLVASLWLVVLYGSWLFNDNPDPSAITLGTAYMRYWLPIFVFWLVPASYLLSKLWHYRLSRLLVIAVISAYLLLSWQLVMLDPEEGLIKIKQNIIRFEQTGQQVQALTSPEAVIVTGITDKFFYPERQVIVDLYKENDFFSVAKLIKAGIPVYHFHNTWHPAEFENYINEQLEPFELSLKPVSHDLGTHSLYQYYLPTL
ncbi:MAG: glycosyltransferase family 39 protein [Patescibacteria group bacterium]